MCYSAILTLPTNYILTLVKPFSFVWYVIPLLKTGAFASTSYLFQHVDDEKHRKIPAYPCPIYAIGSNTHPMGSQVASSEALDLLHWAICAVLYRRTAATIKMASKAGPFFCRCFVCCCPGRRWGNTEQVVARWQRPVASGVALDMPHWEPSVLLRRICKAFKTGHDRSAFWCYCQFCCRP